MGLIARRSFRHFGHSQGVTAYGFLDSRCFSWHSEIVNTAECGSRHVIKGLVHDGIIRSGIRSNDTHGHAGVVFALTRLPGFTFASRIKGIGKLLRHSFGSPAAMPATGPSGPTTK